MKKSDAVYNIKKIVFVLLSLVEANCFSFFIMFSLSDFSFAHKLIYKVDLDLVFYNDSVILPLFMFLPSALISAFLVWIFYKKEISSLGKTLMTVIPVWSFCLFILTNVFGSVSMVWGKWLTLLLQPVTVVLIVFTVREILKYPKKDSIAETANG